MTHTTTRAMLSEHYKAIRSRLNPPPQARPIIQTEPAPIAAPEPVTKHAPRPAVVRRPPPLTPVIPSPSPTARRYVHVLHEVATRHGVEVQDIVGRSRAKRLVAARQEAFYLMKEHGYSMSQIGRFCNRDHTTVMHGIEKHAEKLKGQPL